jgi:hypothetical protein
MRHDACVFRKRMSATVLTVRLTPIGRDHARAAVRRQQFAVGAPVEFDDTSRRVAALEYALGAVGGEVLNGLRAFASRRRLAIDAIEAVVTGELENALAYLEVIGEPGEPRITSIQIKLFVATPDEAALRTMFDDMVDRLPLVCTLRTALQLHIELVFTV